MVSAALFRHAALDLLGMCMHTPLNNNFVISAHVKYTSAHNIVYIYFSPDRNMISILPSYIHKKFDCAAVSIVPVYECCICDIIPIAISSQVIHSGLIAHVYPRRRNTRIIIIC